jgi:Kdo2-lipid IVA lauroyltransferase/acyltransferase
MPERKRMRDIVPGWTYIEYALVRCASAVLNSLPIEVSTAIARFMGDILYAAFKKRRRIAMENLEIAFGSGLPPEKKEHIAREAFRSLATGLIEFFRIPAMLKSAPQRFDFEGTEHLDKVLARGKGLLFIVSHLGSWEYLGFLLYLRKYTCSVVVREVRNPLIYEYIQNLRRAVTLKPIDKKSSIREVITDLKKNRMVALLIDQWAGQEGLWLDFFSRPTSTTDIPARLAVRTGAGMVPGYCLRVGPGRYKIIIRPEVTVEQKDGEADIVATTLKLNRQLEEEIRRYPEQWTWTHRRWKAQSGKKD